VGVSACTDVTGFGLFGHLIGMARRAGVTAQVYADALPAFAGAVEALAEGVIPGAIERNREYVAGDISVADGVDEALVNLGFDAQTSGGLLIAVPREKHEALVQGLTARGIVPATVGRITGDSGGSIAVTLAGQDVRAAPMQEIVDEAPHPAPAGGQRGAPAAAEKKESENMSKQVPAEQTPESAECCADVFAAPSGTGTAAASKSAFSALIRATADDGAIDARTKELLTYALVSLARCGPCITIHRKKAHQMGISDQELDEAVWCATAIGGSCVRVFHDDWLQGGKDAESKSCCP